MEASYSEGHTCQWTRHWKFFEELSKERGGAFVVEDGAPVHTAKITQKWRNEHKITNLPQPAQSPDINAIEHTWIHIKNRINS